MTLALLAVRTDAGVDHDSERESLSTSGASGADGRAMVPGALARRCMLQVEICCLKDQRGNTRQQATQQTMSQLGAPHGASGTSVAAASSPASLANHVMPWACHEELDIRLLAVWSTARLAADF